MMNHTPPMSPQGGPREELEPRVARLEAQMAEVLAILRRVELKLEFMSNEASALRREVAELKGKVSQLPTVLVLVTTLISTFAAGGGLMVAAVRLLRP